MPTLMHFLALACPCTLSLLRYAQMIAQKQADRIIFAQIQLARGTASLGPAACFPTLRAGACASASRLAYSGTVSTERRPRGQGLGHPAKTIPAYRRGHTYSQGNSEVSYRQSRPARAISLGAAVFRRPVSMDLMPGLRRHRWCRAANQQRAAWGHVDRTTMVSHSSEHSRHSAVLPSSALAIPPRPCVPTMARSTFSYST
jgi:hypothetical protein